MLLQPRIFIQHTVNNTKTVRDDSLSEMEIAGSEKPSSLDLVDVHKENLKSLGYGSLHHWLSASNTHCYIGRQNPWVDGAYRSKWANPFSVKKHGLKESLRLYKHHVENGPLIDQIQELKGRVLGCWCINDSISSNPSILADEDSFKCHGHVLLYLLAKDSA